MTSLLGYTNVTYVKYENTKEILQSLEKKELNMSLMPFYMTAKLAIRKFDWTLPVIDVTRGFIHSRLDESVESEKNHLLALFKPLSFEVWLIIMLSGGLISSLLALLKKSRSKIPENTLKLCFLLQVFLCFRLYKTKFYVNLIPKFEEKNLFTNLKEYAELFAKGKVRYLTASYFTSSIRLINTSSDPSFVKIRSHFEQNPIVPISWNLKDVVAKLVSDPHLAAGMADTTFLLKFKRSHCDLIFHPFNDEKTFLTMLTQKGTGLARELDSVFYSGYHSIADINFDKMRAYSSGKNYYCGENAIFARNTRNPIGLSQFWPSLFWLLVAYFVSFLSFLTQVMWRFS